MIQYILLQNAIDFRDLFARNPEEARCRYIAESFGRRVNLYCYTHPSHEFIANLFGLEGENVVGGGRLYEDKTGRLIVDGSSTVYGPVPLLAAKQFSELFANDVKRTKGKEFTGIVVEPDLRDNLNDFWRLLRAA